MRAATAAGGCTVAIVNAAASPLAEAAGHVLPQRAGPEQSVAATKSFICSLVCVARLIALWRRDRTLAAALERLPERLEAALACDWSAALPLLAPAHSLYVVGRGLGFGIVHEWALKLKETSGLHAEALSAAEVRHGPRAVIEQGFPVLALALTDPAGRDAAAFAAELAAGGHTALVASATPVAGRSSAAAAAAPPVARSDRRGAGLLSAGGGARRGARSRSGPAARAAQGDRRPCDQFLVSIEKRPPIS